MAGSGSGLLFHHLAEYVVARPQLDLFVNLVEHEILSSLDRVSTTLQANRELEKYLGKRRIAECKTVFASEIGGLRFEKALFDKRQAPVIVDISDHHHEDHNGAGASSTKGFQGKGESQSGSSSSATSFGSRIQVVQQFKSSEEGREFK